MGLFINDTGDVFIGRTVCGCGCGNVTLDGDLYYSDACRRRANNWQPDYNALRLSPALFLLCGIAIALLIAAFVR